MPDTVIVREGQIQHWYFTSKDGRLLRKNADNLEFMKVHERFVQNLALGCPAAATSFRFPRPTKAARRVVLRHIPTIQLRSFALFEPKTELELLQRFVPPGGE